MLEHRLRGHLRAIGRFPQRMAPLEVIGRLLPERCGAADYRHRRSRTQRDTRSSQFGDDSSGGATHRHCGRAPYYPSTTLGKRSRVRYERRLAEVKAAATARAVASASTATTRRWGKVRSACAKGAALLAAFGLGSVVEIGRVFSPPIGVDILDRAPEGEGLSVEFEATNGGSYRIEDIRVRCVVHSMNFEGNIHLDALTMDDSTADAESLESGRAHNFMCNLGYGRGAQFISFGDRKVSNADITVGLVVQPTFLGMPIPWRRSFDGGQRVIGEVKNGKFHWRRSADPR